MYFEPGSTKHGVMVNPEPNPYNPEPTAPSFVEGSGEEGLAHYGSTAISPAPGGLVAKIFESLRMMGQDMPESGWATQSDLSPMSDWWDQSMGSLSFLNPFPQNRGEEFSRLADAATGAIAGAGQSFAKKAAGRMNMQGFDEAIGKSARIGNLDEISAKVRGTPPNTAALDAKYPRASPQGVGDWRYGARRPNPLEQEYYVPLQQLGGRAKKAFADALAQLVD
jgi:hypothetical protein